MFQNKKAADRRSSWGLKLSISLYELEQFYLKVFHLLFIHSSFVAPKDENIILLRFWFQTAEIEFIFLHWINEANKFLIRDKEM